jgi:CRP-like cAMP-binding protein
MSFPPITAELLGKISLFQALTPEELHQLAQLGTYREVPTQAHAVIEGEPTRGLFILLKGKMSVYKNEHTTQGMARLAWLEDGAAFGELSLLDHAPRSATVSAETNCHLFYLDAQAFEAFLEQGGSHMKARFYHTCAMEMVERFRHQNQDYMASQHLLWKYALRTS